MNQSAAEWSREVRAKHAEARLPSPSLAQPRALSIKPSHLNPTLTPHPVRLLRVTTDYFCAGAVWEKIGPCWSCFRTAPILKWMRGMNPDQAKLALLKMGARYEFLDSNQPRVQDTARAGQSLPSRGGVNGEPQRPKALGTADPLPIAARTRNRPEGQGPQPTIRATPGCDSPDWPKTIAQPATHRMATESASVSTMAGCA